MASRRRLSKVKNLARDIESIQYPEKATCSKCKVEKHSSDFPKAKSEKNGLKSYCKACGKIMRADWYARNREQEIAKTLAYQKAHPEKKKEWARNTYFGNHESRKARNRLGYHENKEDRQAGQLKYYLANRDEILIRCAQYRSTVKAKTKSYLQDYRKSNPERMSSLSNAARVRKVNAEGSHTAGEWLDLKRYYGFKCAYCLAAESDNERLARDHVVPLASGGSDYIENIAPSCKSCNSTKNARSLISFIRYKTILST